MTPAQVTRLGADDVLVHAAGQLCEGPLWDPRIQRVLWVDIPAGLVHETDIKTGADRVVLTDDGPLGCVALRGSGGYLVARAAAVVIVDPEWRRVADSGATAVLPGQRPRTRCNDGRCDPSGAFWVGTLATDDRLGAASLYRMGSGATPHRVIDGVSISNGLDWSPDDTLMYYVDTPTGRIDVLDVDGEDVRGRRSFVEIMPPGLPDGLTVDSDGGIWVALWDGGRVQRYTADGRLDREVLLPCDRVTSMTFAGAQLDRLVITTAYDGLDARQRASQPLAGSIFVHDPGVRGRTPSLWAG